MTIFRRTYTLLLLFCISSAALAQQPGEHVFRFLELSSDARSAALGGAHAAFIEPQSSQFISNPALLSKSSTDRLHLSYLNHIGDIRFGTANYAFSIPGYGTASASIRFLNYGNMTGYDQFGNETGSAAANDLALTAGFSNDLSESLSYGISITGIHSSLAGYQSSAVSVSGGLIYNFRERETALGLYINNSGTQLSTYNGISEPLPLNISVGLVHRFEYLPVRLHLTLQRLNNWNLENPNDTEDPSFFDNLSRHLLGGAEFLFGERITGRIGYDYWLHGQTQTGKRIDGAGLSLGVGIHFNRMDIDFSRTSFSDMGSVVQLGIGIPVSQFL